MLTNQTLFFIENPHSYAGQLELQIASLLVKKFNLKSPTVLSLVSYSPKASDNFVFRRMTSAKSDLFKYHFRGEKTFRELNFSHFIFFDPQLAELLPRIIYNAKGVKVTTAWVATSLFSEINAESLFCLQQCDYIFTINHYIFEHANRIVGNDQGKVILLPWPLKPRVAGVAQSKVTEHKDVFFPLIDPDSSDLEFITHLIQQTQRDHWRFQEAKLKKINFVIWVHLTSKRKISSFLNWRRRAENLEGDFVSVSIQTDCELQDCTKRLSSADALFVFAQDTCTHHALAIQAISNRAQFLICDGLSLQDYIDPEWIWHFKYLHCVSDFTNKLARLLNRPKLMPRLRSPINSINFLETVFLKDVPTSDAPQHVFAIQVTKNIFDLKATVESLCQKGVSKSKIYCVISKDLSDRSPFVHYAQINGLARAEDVSAVLIRHPQEVICHLIAGDILLEDPTVLSQRFRWLKAGRAVFCGYRTFVGSSIPRIHHPWMILAQPALRFFPCFIAPLSQPSTPSNLSAYLAQVPLPELLFARLADDSHEVSALPSVDAYNQIKTFQSQLEPFAFQLLASLYQDPKRES